MDVAAHSRMRPSLETIPDTADRSRLTDDQIRLFDLDGFVAVDGDIPPWLLAGLGAAADTFIDDALDRARAGDPYDGVAVDPDARYVRRINDLHRHLAPWSLALLGSSTVVSLARSLCGNDPIPIYDSLLVKNRGDDDAIRFHQDMTHPRQGRIVTMGIYLDPARRGESALRVLPGTQNERQDLCAIERRLEAEGLKEDPPEERSRLREIAVDAGGILLHDVMLVHGSGTLTSRSRRKTVYFEFRGAAEAARNPGFTSAWIDRRRELFALARDIYHRMDHDEGNRLDVLPEHEQKSIEELYRIRWRIEAGHYCFGRE